MAPDPYKLAVAANNADVLKLSDLDLKAITKVLRDVHDATAAGLESALSAAAKKSAPATYTIAQHAAVLKQVSVAMDIAQKKLATATKSHLITSGASAAKAGLLHTKAMAQAGIKRFQGITHDLRLPEAAILLSHDRTVLSRHHGSAQRYASTVGQRIRHDLAVGLVKGESLHQITVRAMGAGAAHRAKVSYKKSGTAGKLLSHSVIASAVAKKHFFKNKADAARLVRTELSNARAMVQLDALREAEAQEAAVRKPGGAGGHYQKRWDALHDSLTCALCREVDGEIRDLDELFSCGVLHPPLHPNDRCTIVAWHTGWGTPPSMASLRS